MEATAREDVLIVGAGPIGLACACSARRRGIDPLVIDAGPLAASIVGYPIGMTFFTTPELLEIGGHPFPCAAAKPTREEALKYYRGVARAEGLRVRTYTRLLDARPVADGLRCRLLAAAGEEELVARRVVLAIGYFEGPRRLGVPGEERPWVRSRFDEPHLSFGLDVVVVGGGNSAAEAALELFRAGARTTLVHRRAEPKASVKYWVRPDLDHRIAAGEIAARFSTEVVRFEPGRVVVRGPRGEESLAADRAYVLIGFEPDFALLERVGVRLEGEDRVPALDPATLETNVPGVHVVGSVTRGSRVSQVFIENGRFDGEKVFGAPPR